MPYINETCHDAFQRGLEARKAYPLTRGDYKVRESLWQLQRISRTISNITSDLRCNVRGYCRYFGSCTSDDAAMWLKECPQRFAYDLGYNILPAIKALARDGVPANAVSGCLASASSVIPVILDDCEAARIKLSHGIGPEYTRMKAGQSTVQPLVDAVEKLIKVTLKVAQPWLTQIPLRSPPITPPTHPVTV